MKRRKVETSSDEEEESEDEQMDACARANDYAKLQRATYDSQMARVKTDILYRQMFPF